MGGSFVIDCEGLILVGVILLVMYEGYLLVEVMCGMMKCSDNVLICLVYLCFGVDVV